MFATEEGKTDAPKSVGKEFIDASRGLKGLPEQVAKIRDRMKAYRTKK